MVFWQEFKIPMKDPTDLHTNEDLYEVFSETLEPEAIKESNKCITKILDARYEKADLEKIVCEECSHLSLKDQHKLLTLLLEYEELFDGTLGEFLTSPVSLDIMLNLGKNQLMQSHMQYPRCMRMSLKKNSTG